MPAVKMAPLAAGSNPVRRFSAASICSIAVATSGAISRARAVGSMPAGIAHEQLVGEQPAQPPERPAHRRLRQPDPRRRPRHRALADQRIERFQQVQIDRADIHSINE